MQTIKLSIPLLFVEGYLLFTLWLFFFGPLIWPIENKTEFIILISLYHLTFILGYIFSCRFQLKRLPDSMISSDDNVFLRFFWQILFFALIAIVILHRNTTLSTSYIPTHFFSDLARGVLAPAEVRNWYASPDSKERFTGNSSVTALLLFFGVFKYVLLPGLVYYWDKLSRTRSITGFLVAMLPLCTGITASLSAINFYYLFVVSVCLGAVIASKKSRGILYELKVRKTFLVFLAFIFLFSFWQFYSVKSGTSPYSVVFEDTKPASFRYLNQFGVVYKSDLTIDEKKGNRDAITDFYEKLTVYLVQGYQGMSFSLGEKFDSSYGIGHSVFLQKIFAEHFGIDIGERTFQRKITTRWDEKVQWHSFYSHVANDVSFFGVSIVMFILGWYFASICFSIIITDSFYAKMLLPLFAIIFIYIPANNQVFSFLETMVSFWILTGLFILHNRRTKLRPSATITAQEGTLK
ncbi:hypothetical protein [Pseudomonas sp. 52 E 6]|uniref:hypothetical protein n=1 Tax=Pseudomonas sp. 52 E 6 TaxID=1844106 RepID=UPI00081261E4|nr:hypothetical protein [Pseudomonas sp. 52 E 6]CRM56949.1 hypothetical protein [Pseudomonas sp. 52 E 6]